MTTTTIMWMTSGRGGIVVPPLFSVAVTWRILERIWEYIEAKDFPVES